MNEKRRENNHKTTTVTTFINATFNPVQSRYEKTKMLKTMMVLAHYD